LICVENLKRLCLEDIPVRLRTDLLINLNKMTGLTHLYLGYGSVNPERMDKYYSDAFSKMRHLTHFSLRRNCTDHILQILSKASPQSLQCLDVENSRDVTDNGVQYICVFRLRELNIFNCSISVQGLAAIVQTNHSLRELKRGIPLCDALGYQALINEATWTMQKKLKLEVFQASEKVHFHTDLEMSIVAEACPDLKKMIFKYNPEYFSSYLQLAVFEKIRHFETWGGGFISSGLSQLLEIIGGRLEILHLCHVEDIGWDNVVHLTQCCRNVKVLVFENCSFIEEEEDGLNEEALFLKNVKVPPLLELKIFKVINMPLEMTLMILRKSLNIVNIEVDGDIDFKDENITELLQNNQLSKLENLLIYSSKYLTLGALNQLIESCTNLTSVNYLINWKSISRPELLSFWRCLRENNIDIDFGEKEFKEDMQRRKEREDLAKNKATFCSTDILSKMFGTAYQEGEGYAEGDKHILSNIFPQEGEGHRVV